MRDLYLYCEQPPGWAVYPLTIELARQLSLSGYNPIWYYWDSKQSVSNFIEHVKLNPDVLAYSGNAVAAQDLHCGMGIPRKNIAFAFHSRIEMARFYIWAGQGRIWTEEEENNFVPNDEFYDLCNQFRRVGYLNHQHKELLSGVTNKLHTPQYVDVLRFRPTRPKTYETIRVGAAFSIRHHKHGTKGEDILNAVVSTIEQMPDFRFDRRALCGNDGIYGTGLPYSCMPNFFNDLDVLLCTSREEGGPLTPIQAGACGVPTVSTGCGHMKEFIIEGETGFLVESKAEDFVDRLRFLSENRAYLRSMSEKVREHVVAHWSISSAYPQWLRLVAP